MTKRQRNGEVWGYLALLSAPLPWSPACLAGDAIGATPSISGPELMFYISQPIGPSAPSRSYGLRIDQHSLPSMLPAATANASELSGRRELVNLRMAAHENLRLDLGRKVSWDFARRQFNLPGDLPAMTTRFPTHGLVDAGTSVTASLAPPLTAASLPALP